MAFGSLLVLLAGMALGFPELRMIGAAGLAALAAGLLTSIGRLRVEVHRELDPHRVERGALALGLVEIRNPTSRRTRPTTAFDQVGPDEVEVPLPSLAPGRQATRTYRLTSVQRGLVPIGPLRLERTDPLRCWTSKQVLGETQILVVTPRILSLAGLPSGRTRSLDGPTTDSAPNGTVVFHTLRQYVPGDDRRHIHWKATAKSGVLQVKQHVDTSEPKVTIVLATSSDVFADGEAFEEAVDVAASIAVALTRLRFAVRILTPGHAAGRSGPMTTDPAVVLDHLASLPDRGGPPTMSTLVELVREDHGDSVIVITGSLDDGSRATLIRLGHRYRTVVLAHVGPDAQRSPDQQLPGVVVVNGRTAEELAAAWSQVFALRSLPSARP